VGQHPLAARHASARGVTRSTARAWFLYLVRTATGTLYAGVARDVEKRYAAHRAGKGARYLRAHPPRALAYRVAVGDRGQALRVEAAVKRLPKPVKESIVATQPGRARLLRMIALPPAAGGRGDETVP
jgi:putative endonuclease